MQFPTISWSEKQSDNKLYGLRIRSKSDLENVEGYYALDFTPCIVDKEILNYIKNNKDKFRDIKYVKNLPRDIEAFNNLVWLEFENTSVKSNTIVTRDEKTVTFKYLNCAKNIKINNCIMNSNVVFDCENLEIRDTINAVNAALYTVSNRCAKQYYDRYKCEYIMKYQIKNYKSDWWQLVLMEDQKMESYEGPPPLLEKKDTSRLCQFKNYHDIKLAKLYISDPDSIPTGLENVELVKSPIDLNPHQYQMVVKQLIQNMIDRSTEELKMEIRKLERQLSKFNGVSRIVHKIDPEELQSVIANLRNVNAPIRSIPFVAIREFLAARKSPKKITREAWL